MAKAWSTFYDWVMPEVPGVGEPMANRALCDAAIEFYKLSGLVVAQLAPITVIPGTATYDMVPPVGYDVSRIEEMFFGDMRLFPVSNTDLARMYFNWVNVVGSPQYYMSEASSSFRLVPKPDPAMTFTDTIVPRVVLVPTRAATEIAEDWVYEDWGDAIAAGAVALLMQMPQKPWTDLTRAAGFADVFRRGATAAKADANRGKVGAALSVRLRRHF